MEKGKADKELGFGEVCHSGGENTVREGSGNGELLLGAGAAIPHSRVS